MFLLSLSAGVGVGQLYAYLIAGDGENETAVATYIHLPQSLAPLLWFMIVFLLTLIIFIATVFVPRLVDRFQQGKGKKIPDSPFNSDSPFTRLDSNVTSSGKKAL